MTDLPTQAGMPVFHDDDEVDWLRARTEKPEPPPPLEALPPKPLFAPDPPAGEPVRRPRPGSRAASGHPEYWPWDASQDSSRDSGVRPVGRDTGSWGSGSGSWPGAAWGTGDSDMFRYAPYCDVVTVCNTLRHLERVVADLLKDAA